MTLDLAIVYPLFNKARDEKAKTPENFYAIVTDF